MWINMLISIVYWKCFYNNRPSNSGADRNCNNDSYIYPINLGVYWHSQTKCQSKDGGILKEKNGWGVGGIISQIISACSEFKRLLFHFVKIWIWNSKIIQAFWLQLPQLEGAHQNGLFSGLNFFFAIISKTFLWIHLVKI